MVFDLLDLLRAVQYQKHRLTNFIVQVFLSIIVVRYDLVHLLDDCFILHIHK